MFIMYIVVVYSVLNGSGMIYEKEKVQKSDQLKTQNYISRIG